MKKIDLSTAPTGEGTRYPAPHDAPCKARRWIKLAEAAGLTQLGVNLVTIPPGGWSSQRHWHEKEDEFLWMLDGELVLITDEGEEIMRAGDCAGFKAGDHNGHHLQNRSNQPARFIVVSDRDDDDWGEYSDIDMKFTSGKYSGTALYTTKDGKKL
jgi:uncharacterized cupin superfamily protein